MLNTRYIELGGKDAGRKILLTERPALVADRIARAALKQLGVDPTGGVIALAFRHISDLRAMGEASVTNLLPLLDARVDGAAITPNNLRDWRNVDRLLQAALALHVDFLIGREVLEVPVAMQAETLFSGMASARATFCSPHIAAVLQSQQATYRELETVLGTEDVFNLVELINAEAVQQWHAAYQAGAN